jgi:two-component system sensor histidine kinase KdpD
MAGMADVVGEGGTVLLVDDDRDTRRLFAIILEGAGYRCLEAADAEAAVELLGSRDVDVALVDVLLGADDGVALARRVLALEPPVAVVMVSGVDDPAIAEAAGDLGAYGYLLKPVRRGELLLHVANAFRRHQLERRQRELVGELEQRVAERTAALEAALRRAEEAEVLRAQFVQNLSHELRSPLTVIVASADLLPRTPDDEARQQISDAIDRQANRLRTLIDRLIAVASIDEAFHEEGLDRIDLRGFLAVAVEPARAAGRRVMVTVDGGGRHEPPLYAPARRLGAALGHIVENALRFSPASSPVSVEACVDGRDWVIRVIDHGPGIAPELRHRLWEPFVQGDGGVTRRHNGLGVGLYLCRRLVEGHGGTVDAEDTPGGGLTIVLRLPLRADDVG